MKLVLPGINTVFDFDEFPVQTLVIENPNFFYKTLLSLQEQLEGMDGKTVLSQNDRILQVPKYMEMHSQFVPFTINQKLLVSRAASTLEKYAVEDAVNYPRTLQIISSLEEYLLELSCSLTGDIHFGKLNIGAIIKAAGLEFEEEYESLPEKLLDYMELVEEYDQKKVFLFVNLHSYISDSEMNLFLEGVMQHNHSILLIENSCYSLQYQEKRRIIDKDLCEI